MKQIILLYYTFVEFCKHHYVMQPLQNPPSCSWNFAPPSNGCYTQYIGVEMKYGECICPPSWSVYTATLYVMANKMKGVGLHPPLSPAWANFCIIMDCTSESGHCHALCVYLCGLLATVCSLNQKRGLWTTGKLSFCSQLLLAPTNFSRPVSALLRTGSRPSSGPVSALLRTGSRPSSGPVSALLRTGLADIWPGTAAGPESNRICICLQILA